MRLSDILFTAASILGFFSSTVQGHSLISEDGLHQLKAAHKYHELSKRGGGIHPLFEVELVYAEDENDQAAAPVFGARVLVQSTVPVMKVEEFEHYLEAVQCADDGTSIALRFRQKSDFQMAKRSVEIFDHCMVITSHGGCNEEGERNAYKVKKITVHKDDLMVELTVERMSWKKAFKSYSIEYGFSSEPHLLRRNDVLRRSEPTQTLSQLQTLVPTSSPTATAVNVDLTHALINTEFDLPVGPSLPVTSSGCKNCSTFGTMVLTQGKFEIDLEALDADNNTAATKLIKGGFVEMNFQNFGAYMELFTNLDATVDFSKSLLNNLPVLGFTIPGFGQAGFTFALDFIASFTLVAPVTLTYGFEVSVPNNSTVKIDFANFGSSGQTGLDHTRFQALDFQADSEPASLTVGAGLRPLFPFGFSFVGDQLMAEVALFIDLPTLSMNVSQVVSADAHCEPLPPTNLTSAQQAARELFKTNLTHIAFDAALDLGFDAGLAVPLKEIGSINTAVTILSTIVPLPTACLSFDTKQGSFIPATQVLASATGPGGALATSTHASGAHRISAPGHAGRSGRGGGVGSVVGAALFLAVILVML